LNILGISSHYHDSACCLLQDGKLVAASQQERFSRIKNDAGIPLHAMRYCLDAGDISVGDVDIVAYYEKPVEKLARQLWMQLPNLLSIDTGSLHKLDSRRPEREIRDILGLECPIEWIGHHRSHAASAFFFSPYPEAAVFVADGVGEWDTTTYWCGRESQLSQIHSLAFPHSIGLLYSTLTAYLGFEVLEGEYKVMGLAPYGAPRYVDQCWQLIEESAPGKFSLNMLYFQYQHRIPMYAPQLIELFGSPSRSAGDPITQYHCDVARSLQIVLQSVLLTQLQWLHSQVPTENVCLAGGVALNCVANRYLLENGPFKRMFVQPAAGDAGTALGAAAAAQISHFNQRPTPLKHVYLGPGYDSDSIVRLLKYSDVKYIDCRNDSQTVCQLTAQRLAAGKIIGWFHGRMEFGPRSLGARSILADPRVSDMRDRINKLVKKRESFRPFAPAVIRERAAEHFQLDHDSPYMLETCPVISDLDLPAITHVDGSARVQTVRADEHAVFHQLLVEFAKLTGCPLVLNTSFNVRGEPIVCSPIDAILCFLRANLDCLVLEDIIIDRSSVPNSWYKWFENTGFLPSRFTQETYTFL
jgi:carbamoyltransferase